MVSAIPQPQQHQSFFHFAEMSPAPSPPHSANATPSPSNAGNYNNAYYNPATAPMIRSFSELPPYNSPFDQPYMTKQESIPPTNMAHQNSFSFDIPSNNSHASSSSPSTTSGSFSSYPSMSPPTLQTQVSNGAYPAYNFADPALALVTPTRSVSFMHSMIGEDIQDENSNSQFHTAPQMSTAPFGSQHVVIPPALVPSEQAPRGSLNRFLPEDQMNNDNALRSRKRTRDALPLYPIVPHPSEYAEFPSDGDFDDDDGDVVGESLDDDAASLYSDKGANKRAKASSGPGSVISSGSSSVRRIKQSDSDDGESINSHGSLSKRDKSGRHVSPAIKLVGSEENTNIHTTVTQMYYRHEGKNHRVRLIRVRNYQTHSDDVYAHGADVGSVVERKSNISRLFGKFKSPQEKLLMNVPGPHNHTVGQESNILTVAGLHTFLATNKMKGQSHYAQWITHELIPKLQNPSTTDQLELETDDRVKRSATANAANKSASTAARKLSPAAVPVTNGASSLQPTPRTGRRQLQPYSPAVSEASSLPSSPQSYASLSTLDSTR